MVCCVPSVFAPSDSLVIGLQGCIACHNLLDAMYEGFLKQAKQFSSWAHAICHTNQTLFSLQFRVV